MYSSVDEAHTTEDYAEYRNQSVEGTLVDIDRSCNQIKKVNNQMSLLCDGRVCAEECIVLHLPMTIDEIGSAADTRTQIPQNTIGDILTLKSHVLHMMQL